MSNCVLCGSKVFRLVFAGNGWRIEKCSGCGLVRTERGRGADYGNYHRDQDYRKFEDLFRNIFQKRVDLITKFIASGGRVLEIGCSTGVMLGIFRELGWEVWGVEPSASGNLARARGIRIVRSRFEEARLPKSYFDLVILNHTLEHMDNPVSVLRKVRQVLGRGGYLLVDVPNFGSLGSQILGRHWPFLLSLEHNFQFTRETLSRLFEKTGFEVVYFESRSGVFDMAHPVLELWQSLATLKKRFFTNLLCLPYAFCATSLNMGDAMTVIGRKSMV